MKSPKLRCQHLQPKVIPSIILFKFYFTPNTIATTKFLDNDQISKSTKSRPEKTLSLTLIPVAEKIVQILKDLAIEV